MHIQNAGRTTHYFFNKKLILKNYNYFLLLPLTHEKYNAYKVLKNLKKRRVFNSKGVTGISAQQVLQSTTTCMQWCLTGLAGLILQITLHTQMHGAKNFTSVYGLCELRTLEQKADCWTKNLNSCMVVCFGVFSFLTDRLTDRMGISQSVSLETKNPKTQHQFLQRTRH